MRARYGNGHRKLERDRVADIPLTIYLASYTLPVEDEGKLTRLIEYIYQFLTPKLQTVYRQKSIIANFKFSIWYASWPSVD